MRHISLLIILLTRIPASAQDDIWNETYARRTSDGNLPDVLASLPVSVNRINEEQLRATQVLSSNEIKQFLKHRATYGVFVSKYELQVIPGFTPDKIRQLEKFVVFNELGFDVPAKRQPGIWPMHVSLTSTIKVKNGISYRKRFSLQAPGKYEIGLRADQDEKETFRIKPPEQWGFDHVSAYLLIPLRQKVTHIILGDFRVHMGQGMIHNAAFRMGKGAELPLPSLSGYVVPSGSFNETGNLTGIACEMDLGRIRCGYYASLRNEDASVKEDGSFTAVSTNGLHRTSSEKKNRNTISLTSVGGFAEYSLHNAKVGFGINSDFLSRPMKHTSTHKSALPEGKRFLQYTIYGHYRWENILAWFEVVPSLSFNISFQTGLSIALGRNFECLFLTRKYGQNLFSFYGNSFGEYGTANRNEKGIYLGLRYSIRKRWKITAYADIYYFPWYSYRRNSALRGKDFRLDVEWRGARNWRIRGFLKNEIQSRSTDGNELYRSRMQVHVFKTYGNHTELRLRLQANKYINGSSGYGKLISADYIMNRNSWQANFRVMYFGTSSYQTREFISERDVWGSFSLPSYHGKGLRTVIMIRKKFGRTWTVWLRYASTFYAYEKSKAEFKLQVKYTI